MHKPSCCAIALLSVLSPLGLNAATLVGFVSSPSSSTVNLTQQGSLDWAVWDITSGTATTGSAAPTNQKSGGLGTIGNISAVGGVSMSYRGSATTSSKTYSYSDGVAPTTLTASTQGIVFNATLGSSGVSTGAGVQTTVGGIAGKNNTVYLWATGFGGQGTLTASLNGAAPVILLSPFYSTGQKVPTLFFFNFNPDSVSDLLTLRYVLTTATEPTFAHVAFQAIALAPEPAPLGFLALGALALGGVRRRSRRG